MSKNKQQVYRVAGLSCTNCAAKFEKNVSQLPNVKTAKVNFGASKLSIEGEATIAEIEAAGAFENLRIQSEHDPVSQVAVKAPFVNRNWHLLLSLF